jgi:hypothetical protein
MFSAGNLQKMSSLAKPRVSPPALIAYNNLMRTGGDTIAKIENLEVLMSKEPQVEMELNHYFGENVYVRELFFKAGTIATGGVQKLHHVSIMLSGHMTIWTPDKGVHDVFGPSITEVSPGMKRAGYAHTDTHWICAYGIQNPEQYHADELIDILTFKKYGDYTKFINEHTLNIGE